MIALLAFLPAIAIGILVTILAWPGPYLRNFPLKLSISLAIGPGIVSGLYFAWSLFMRPRSRAYFLAEFILLLALLIAAWYLRKRKSAQAGLFFAQPRAGILSRILIAVFIITLVLAGVNFVLQVVMQPHGIQDAWNIWNMRARFLFRGGPGWTALFSPELYWLNHADYPFLITAGTARAWSFNGSESTLVPTIQAALYACALVGLVSTGAAAKRGWSQGSIAGMILAASPIFVLLAGWQIADVPLAFFLTASVYLMVLIIENPNIPGFHILYGLCVGLAAWTKNEGIPWLIICLVLIAAVQMTRRKSIRIFSWGAAGLLIGMAIPLFVLFYLKFILAPTSDLFAGQSSSGLLERLLDPQRYILTATYVIKAFAGISPIGLAVLPTIPFLMVYIVLFAPGNGSKTKLRVLYLPFAAVIAQGLGYFLIYLITPHDLVWHLRTAVDRLVFHLTPPLILLVMLISSPVEETVAIGFNLRNRRIKN